MSSYVLSLHRCIATCGCTDEGPGQQCEEGQHLFELVSQAYTRAHGESPREHLPWAAYETHRARYYAHLGEMANYLDMMSSFAISHLERLLRSARIAVQVTRDDVKRNLEPLTLCEETGSERAERFECGLGIARERLETIWKALNDGREVQTTAFLWRSTPTENELFAAFVRQEPASHDAQAQEEETL